jgi:hypothetical protein
MDKKVRKTPSQPTSQTWWHIPVVPAMRLATEKSIMVQDHPWAKM